MTVLPDPADIQVANGSPEVEEYRQAWRRARALPPGPGAPPPAAERLTGRQTGTHTPHLSLQRGRTHVSYLNMMFGPAKTCGCAAGWSDTVGDVTILGHIAECPEFHQPRRYTWTSGSQTRTGDLAALVADRDAWAPSLLTDKTRTVPVQADDGERYLRAAPLENFGQTPGTGWRVMVDDERVDIPTGDDH